MSGGVGGQFQLIAPRGRPACTRFPSGANHVDRHSLVVVLFTLFTLLAYVNYSTLGLRRACVATHSSFLHLSLGMVLALTVVCITQNQRYAAHDQTAALAAQVENVARRLTSSADVTAATASPFVGRLRTVEHGVAPGSADDGFAWHGQELQDCMAYSLLRRKKGGTFIDLAANDWRIFSNSLSLERDHGWTGLCIEPNPVYHPGLLRYRTCDVVSAYVSETEEFATFSALPSATAPAARLQL